MTDRNLMTVAGTCNRSGHGTKGFANLQFRKIKEGVSIDPHVTGACSITLDWSEVAKVTDWLNTLTVA
jgi:hypothetical protein